MDLYKYVSNVGTEKGDLYSIYKHANFPLIILIFSRLILDFQKNGIICDAFFPPFCVLASYTK